MSSKTALIFGIGGQDGSFLADFLLRKNYHVVGVARSDIESALPGLKYLKILNSVEIVPGDICNFESVDDLIKNRQFDEIYNLAAQSSVMDGWKYDKKTYEVNSLGVLHILCAIKEHSRHSRFFQASSSEMFGRSVRTTANEESPFNPMSPYGVSKLMAHKITDNFRTEHGLYASAGILFNHESFLRPARFVTKKIVSGLIDYAANNTQVLMLGNLSAARDWGYAPDFVEGFWRILQAKQPDDFVLATGAVATVRDFVDMVSRNLGLEIEWRGDGVDEVGLNARNGTKMVQVDPEFYRPNESFVLRGSPKKALLELDWRSKTNLRTMIAILVAEEIRSRRSYNSQI